MKLINSRENVLDFHVERVKKAYPAYFDTYEHIDINLSEGIKAKSFDNLLEKVEYKDEQD